MLEEKILNIKTEAFQAAKEARTREDVSNLRVKYLGRKSELNEILKSLKNLSEDEKRKIGPLANMVKKEIEEDLDRAEKMVRAKEFNLDLDKIDVTIPGTKLKRGHLHILTQVQAEIEDIFTSMGFEIADGPEVEKEWYNFDALNIPKDHPARDMQDTFWIKSEKERILPRTHTSNVQVRYMERHTPPFRIIAPGRIFRNEATDANHEHTFHQFEALMVGDDINVANFKFVAEQFFSKFFKKDIKIRLRPSFFPFTEPSFEFDISCTVCGGAGCRTCKGGGWLEVGGAGMVNQNVFEAAGYPRNKYQGFAWGFGVERLAMMRHKIDDIRLFHSGDLRFIKQF